MTPRALALAAALAATGCGGGDGPAPLRLVLDDPTDAPMRGLSADEQAGFDRGDALFARQYLPTQGLGPVFVRASCASCHAADGRGPGFVERAIAVGADGYTPAPDQSVMPFGPVVRPYFVAPATRGVEAPAEGTPGLLRSVRVGPAVFGRGWIEAVDESEPARVAAAQGLAGRVHGRVPRLADGRLGRFGLKARIATLEEFAADAFRGDMGLTSPLAPTEVANAEGLADDQRPGVDLDQASVGDVGAYLRALALPRREGIDPRGRALFERARCSDCHVPALRTRADARPAVLASTEAEIYSDLLLHDMGAGLADGVAEGAAGPRDWRTAPLIGLRFFRSMLHDGRARSLEEAVRMHRGDESEANGSVDAFEALPAADRAALLDFVGRL
jgi:CxxC motif-containing protein (DUF1111 family)